MYELRFHREVDKELKNVPIEVRRKVKNYYFPRLAEEPRSAGTRLSGGLSGFWRLDFKMVRTEYRIAYEIDDEENVVYVLMVGKRESFYERLKRRAL
jgi:mRNA-degrading endonuclease RelE of RelBE toxin-antitoxin system